MKRHQELKRVELDRGNHHFSGGVPCCPCYNCSTGDGTDSESDEDGDEASRQALSRHFPSGNSFEIASRGSFSSFRVSDQERSIPHTFRSDRQSGCRRIITSQKQLSFNTAIHSTLHDPKTTLATSQSAKTEQDTHPHLPSRRKSSLQATRNISPHASTAHKSRARRRRRRR